MYIIYSWKDNLLVNYDIITRELQNLSPKQIYLQIFTDTFILKHSYTVKTSFIHRNANHME